MNSVFDVFALIVKIKAYVNMPVVYHIQKDRLQLVLLSMDQLIFGICALCRSSSGFSCPSLLGLAVWSS